MAKRPAGQWHDSFEQPAGGSRSAAAPLGAAADRRGRALAPRVTTLSMPASVILVRSQVST